MTGEEAHQSGNVQCERVEVATTQCGKGSLTFSRHEGTSQATAQSWGETKLHSPRLRQMKLSLGNQPFQRVDRGLLPVVRSPRSTMANHTFDPIESLSSLALRETPAALDQFQTTHDCERQLSVHRRIILKLIIPSSGFRHVYGPPRFPESSTSGCEARSASPSRSEVRVENRRSARPLEQGSRRHEIAKRIDKPNEVTRRERIQ
jgi:hypothetical protein